MTDLPRGTRTPDDLSVVVAGDVTLDWNLARESMPAADPGPGPTALGHRGGAALLSDLVRLVADTLPVAPGDTAGVAVDGSAVDATANSSYALWTRAVPGAGAKAPSDSWKVQSLLGVDRATGEAVVRTEWQRLRAAVGTADVVVLDDAALGFRDQSELTLWQDAYADPGRRGWIVLKQTRPVAEGPLWEHLLATAADRLIGVVMIDDLRGREVQVSRDLSWERTAQDLLWELVHTPGVNALSRIAHTVVSFGSAGALLLSANRTGPPTCSLFFDPQQTEGTVASRTVMGSTDTLTAALVREVLLRPGAPDLAAGIQSGVGAMRRLQHDGYQQRGAGRLDLGFPLAAVVEEMQSGLPPLCRAEVRDPADSERWWTILEDGLNADLAATAEQIVREGPEHALAGVPLGRFGNLVTADRSEIEAFRSMATLIDEYVHGSASKPLSIAVFGPPGAGKSFGVKEVARAVGGDLVDKPLEFNLAQLRGPDDLVDALHLVRDRALAGRIPLVFFDEFDTSLEGQPLGWLRYFLAPMQDGEFRQGQVTHPIGKAIFVFAGGTSAREQDFADAMHGDAARSAKGPDFVSRLKGFVNILGPNPQGDSDPFHVIRRAILLRSILARSAPGLLAGGQLHLDPGVLRAFLQTREYRHGARSLEAVIAMSRLSGKTTYERSCLPPEVQLDLHVDAEDFLALVHRPVLAGDLLDRLARAAHSVYRDAAAAPVPDWDELPEQLREQSRDNVRDIPAKLAQVDCVMVPGRADLIVFRWNEQEIETLARAEHDRWIAALGPGWSHGPVTDRPRKIHEAYLPWSELPEDQRVKDRELVEQIPLILHQAGFAVVRRCS